MSDEGKLTLVGTCGEVREKNGWTAFVVSVPGKDYPVKLSTKLEAIIEQGRAVGPGIATWTYKESQGGENPNKPGTFYTNRYLEGVEAGATPEAAAEHYDAATRPTAGGTTTAVHAVLHEADRQRIIARQACIKAAAALYSGAAITATGSEYDSGFSALPPGAVIEAAERFEIWVYRDLDGPPF